MFGGLGSGIKIGVNKTTASTRITEMPGENSISAGYPAPAQGYDELLGPDGLIREPWRRLIAGIDGLGAVGIKRRWQAARRLLHENGITYNIHGDPQGLERPWELDTMPLVLGADEWRRLEEGLVQRAHLLNLILTDVYGPQKLMREGLLPPALVFGNPNFLRPVHGTQVPGDSHLHFVAFDLARSPDGNWWVLADRTQAPAGAGYALENRIVMSRCLPDLFADCNVRRLAPFFQAMRETLHNLAVRTDNPRTVLLSSGPTDEGYFEHAYLARYLGFTLVEGADLTVRDNRVYIKTLSGLKQVDVVLRRVRDEAIDPLELRDDSDFGVAGMVQAVKAGNVVVANALGSGIAECEGLWGFLPAISRKLLGEDLKIPSVATWWCGEPAARDHVLENLDDLVVKKTFDSFSIFTQGVAAEGVGLSPENRRAELTQALTHYGYKYIAQEVVHLSTTPATSDGRLVPRPMALRVYLTASNGSYTVMPGGLTRFTDSDDARTVALRYGAGSKDTWVLADGPAGNFSLLRPADAQIPLRRVGADLPSRAADNLFWLGRYAERAEGVMRLLRGLMVRMTGDTTLPGTPEDLNKLLNVLIIEGQIAGKVGRKRRDRGVVDGAPPMFDPRYSEGLRKTLSHLYRTATLVRDRLSLDAWRILNRLNENAAWKQPEAGLDVGRGLEQLDDMILTMAAFSGMEMENMTRSQGWRFLDMGRRLERALHMVVLLRVLLASGDPEHDGGLELVLTLADSFMTYRSRYLTSLHLAPVLDLLLTDESNPRSVAFQIAALSDHVKNLPRDADLPSMAADQRIVTRTLTDIQLINVDRLCVANAKGERVELNRFLNQLGGALPEFSEVIARIYFSHADRIQERRSQPGGIRRENEP